VWKAYIGLRFFGNRECTLGIARDCPKIFWLPARPINSETGKATNFKFGRYSPRVRQNKSPFQSLQKREPTLPTAQFFGGIPIILRTGKAIRTSNFMCTFIGSIGTKKNMKNFGKSSPGRSQGIPKIFRAPVGHIVRSSLR